MQFCLIEIYKMFLTQQPDLEFSDGVDDLLYPIPLRIRNYQNNGGKNWGE